MNREIKVRFLSHVKVGDGCWEWTASLSKYGYGQFKYKGLMRNAQRASYELFVGEIAPGLVICHSCDNRKCVRPSHLWIGTQKENVADMDKKGRRAKEDGENNGRAVLNWEKADLIRIRRKAGMTLSSIAKEFGVGTSTISRVVANRNWMRK